mgnify:CR=1 FL=1
MAKKVYEIMINATSQCWEQCFVAVEANSAKEAKELFEANPYDYDWEDWHTQDSEMQHWEVERVDVCETSTEKLQEQHRLDRLNKLMEQEDLND